MKLSMQAIRAIRDDPTRRSDMTTVFVTCAGDAGTRFDRDYHVGTHLPLVLEAWRRPSACWLTSSASPMPHRRAAGPLSCRMRAQVSFTW